MSYSRSLQSIVLKDEDGNVVGVVLDGSVYRLETVGKVLNASGSQVSPAIESKQDTIITKLGEIDTVLDLIKDTNGIADLGKWLGSAAPTVGQKAMASSIPVTLSSDQSDIDVLIRGKDSQGTKHDILTDGDGALKVVTQPPEPPPGTTEFVLAISEAALTIGGGDSPAETVSATIGNGVDLYLQQFVAGAAGDPSEKGSKVELYWREGAGPTDHLIERMYVAGQSVALTLPDANKARDGTAMTGNGTNTKLVISRSRLSNADQEVDAIVRGYTE